MKSIAFGVNFSNIGSKISYDQGSNKEFLPANIKLGTTFTQELNDLNAISVSFDVNKLLVPTPVMVYEQNGSGVILPNYNTNKPVISSIFGSFTDAPGGFKEEMQEFMISTGIEYWYSKKFAIRTGYFHEALNKGNRKFFTAGVGVKMSKADIDLSYVIPTQRNNPLANTVRFTLLFNIDSFLKKKDVEPAKDEPINIEPTKN